MCDKASSPSVKQQRQMFMATEDFKKKGAHADVLLISRLLAAARIRQASCAVTRRLLSDNFGWGDTRCYPSV